MSSNSETPNFSQYDNALFVQVFANNSIVTTACFINVNAQPPLVSDASPVVSPNIRGAETARMVIYNGQAYTNFVLQGNDSIEVG